MKLFPCNDESEHTPLFSKVINLTEQGLALETPLCFQQGFYDLKRYHNPNFFKGKKLIGVVPLQVCGQSIIIMVGHDGVQADIALENYLRILCLNCYRKLSGTQGSILNIGNLKAHALNKHISFNKAIPTPKMYALLRVLLPVSFLGQLYSNNHTISLVPITLDYNSTN